MHGNRDQHQGDMICFSFLGKLLHVNNIWLWLCRFEKGHIRVEIVGTREEMLCMMRFSPQSMNFPFMIQDAKLEFMVCGVEFALSVLL